MDIIQSQNSDEIIHVKVRELCDFICRAGSLDSWAGTKRMIEGTRLHNIIQSRAGAGYIKEVTLRRIFKVDGTLFELSGRADGILDELDSFTVDEIKTTTIPLRFLNEKDYPAHRAQAECYAYIFALDKNLDFMRTRLTYANLETEDMVYFYEEHTIDELRSRVEELLLEYRKWYILRQNFVDELQTSAKNLVFPYRDLRNGQDDMIRATYRAIRNYERLFVEAPTGIGKTMSAIYPSFLALGKGLGKRIFYFTSKTTLKNAAANAVELLRKNGLRARMLILTAKEKCCLCKEAVKTCDSMLCEYSDGHFSRINSVLLDMLNNFETFDESLIETYAREYKVCPYELSLDLALWSDIIICDYNYLFDPRVSIKRFFDENCKPDENIFLIDEAHNLAERAREMYSSELSFVWFFRLLKRVSEEDPFFLAVKGICKAFLALKRRAAANFDTPNFDLSKAEYEAFGAAVEYFVSASTEWLRVNHDAPFANEVVDCRFCAMDYMYKLAEFDDCFVNYTEASEESVRVKILCIDPSKLLSNRLEKGRSALFFSATLTPIDYFSKILGGGEKTVTLELNSPFPRKNLFVGVMEKVSTRFQDRNDTIFYSAQILDAVVRSKAGNYIAFFPSYKLMRETLNAFREINRDTKCLVQRSDMLESDRDSFLKCFDIRENDRSMLAFAVLGGIFSEGIDLVGERLIGAVIVGVGLAQLNNESNIISAHYDESGESGFDYAYTYPGMNKVLQAAGRVIRTETDRGAVILIDDRFATPKYTSLFPPHWRDANFIGDVRSLSVALKHFWNR